jgi:hypothetical protein
VSPSGILLRRRAVFFVGLFAFVLSLSGLLGSIVWAAILRSRADLVVIFHDAPLHIVPEGHVRQVKVLKRRIPKSGTLFYIMNPSESWQSRLWERSLFPDNHVLFIDAAQLHDPVYNQLRSEKLIRYAISQGETPVNTVFKWSEVLPQYPGSIPLIFGELSDDSTGR